MSPCSRTASSTASALTPTASPTACITSLFPIPISLSLQTGNTLPKIINPTCSRVVLSNFTKKSAIMSVFSNLLVVFSKAEYTSTNS